MSKKTVRYTEGEIGKVKVAKDLVGRSDKGLILTTGNFTADARREATRDGAPAIDLLDGDALCELMKSLKLGVTTRQVEEVSVNANAFENF